LERWKFRCVFNFANHSISQIFLITAKNSTELKGGRSSLSQSNFAAPALQNDLRFAFLLNFETVFSTPDATRGQTPC